MTQHFIIPQTRPSSREQLIQAMQNPPVSKVNSSQNPLLSMAAYQGEVFGRYVKNTESKMKLERQKGLQMSKRVA